jgi:dihydroxy-acid dehydratase
MDGVLIVGGCDKNMPAGAMAMARVNVPASTSTRDDQAGPLERPGADDRLGVRGRRRVRRGKMAKEDYDGVERNACPSVGACGGMYTANTMSSSFEALGISLLGSSQMASPDGEKADSSEESAKVLVEAIKRDLKPRDIITRKSIENAIALVMATAARPTPCCTTSRSRRRPASSGRSTISSACGARAGLCDLKPSGKYVATDFHRAAACRRCCACCSTTGPARRLHHDHRPPHRRGARARAGEAARRTGRDPPVGQADVRRGPPRDPARQPLARRLRREDHRPQEPVDHRPARVFDSEPQCMEAIMAKKIRAGDVVVIRYEGPKGGPGMQEMLAPTSALIGQGLGESVGLLTDGRFSGAPGAWSSATSRPSAGRRH